MVSLLPALDLPGARRFASRWEAMFDEGDWRGMAAMYAEDALLIATAMETLHGRPAIERFWREACDGARADGVRRKVMVEQVEEAAGLGYMRGTVLLHLPERHAAMQVRYVTVWKREPDGAWRLAVDISSAGPSAAPVPASAPEADGSQRSAS